jgi:hypothetical protein
MELTGFKDSKVLAGIKGIGRAGHGLSSQTLSAAQLSRVELQPRGVGSAGFHHYRKLQSGVAKRDVPVPFGEVCKGVIERLRSQHAGLGEFEISTCGVEEVSGLELVVSQENLAGLEAQFTVVDVLTAHGDVRVETAAIWCRCRTAVGGLKLDLKPRAGGFIESFNAQFRREQLSGEIIDTMAEAGYLAEEWKAIYSHERHHGSWTA